MPDITLPGHAYVPGETERHPEETFALYHASVAQHMSPEDLQETLSWRAGLVFLDNGFFWEAHEVLEPVWMATPRDSAEHQMVQAVIQIANAALKLKMRRPAAAKRLCHRARDHLRAARSSGGEVVMGQSVQDMLSRVESIEQQVS